MTQNPGSFPLSRRGLEIVAKSPTLVNAHLVCAADPFDPRRNPQGYINLGTAENHLLWDWLGPRLNETPALDEEIALYNFLFGTHPFRQAIAGLLGRQAGREIDPEQLVVASGSSTIVYLMLMALCDPGDEVLLPAPYYAGFPADFAGAGAVPLPIPLSSAEGFELTAAKVMSTLDAARGAGRRVRALLLTSPHNPLGRVYPEKLLRELIELCAGEGLHCIVDEIYANSIYGQVPFVSALRLAPASAAHVHLVYGFAKDFGLSGFKVGIGHSRNDGLIQAMRALCYFSPVSTHTQEALTRCLADESGLTLLFDENRKRLAQAYAQVVAGLRGMKIPFLDANAGFFVFVDFRNFLKRQDWEGERELASLLLERGRVSLTPGETCGCPEPGWFRLCFADRAEVLRVGLERIGRTLPRQS